MSWLRRTLLWIVDRVALACAWMHGKLEAAVIETDTADSQEK